MIRITTALFFISLIFFGCINGKKATSPQYGNITPRYNVLFISVDDLRPELGYYGKEHMITPNIDKLAKSGRPFRNHFVHVAACGPSRSTLLAGKRTLSWDIFKDIREAGAEPDDIFSLPQLFKKNGYRTVSIGKISHTPGGKIDSLQTIDEVPYSWDKTYAPVGDWKDPWSAFFSYAGGNTKKYRFGRDGLKNPPPFEIADVPDEGYADGLNAKEAIDQLNKLKDSTFFLAVGFYKPHLPFNAPKKYWDLYDPEKIPETSYEGTLQNVRSNISLHYSNESYEPRKHYVWPNDTTNYILTPEREKILRHGYCAAVSYVDAQIGKVLDALKRLGLDKNTIVVLWGDHGWHLGDYGIWGKFTNFDIALRSPLIIMTPNMNQPGMFAEGMVETVDIFPTLADICKLPVPTHLEGESMKSTIDDPTGNKKDYTIGERMAWGYHGLTIRDERYRLMVWKKVGQEDLDIELYDYSKNVLPSVNIADENPEILEKLMKELKSRRWFE